MKIQQWEDKGLAHFSYAVLSECEKKIVLIDPARNPQPYLEFAKENESQIVGVIETHPHADFVSSHLELSERTGATLYVHSLVNAFYPHEAFDEGHAIEIGKIKLYPLYTPGHSPDSICIVLEHEGKSKAVFTGDTLFIGDCGRPDLREGVGNLQVTREKLASQMYHSLRDKLLPLPDDTIVYPAHGAGSLCGKALKAAQSSTMGEEKKTNWCLQDISEDEFVKQLLADQPFVPAYFPFDVDLNRKGAPSFQERISAVTYGDTIKNTNEADRLDKNIWVVDVRNAQAFQQGHLPHSINIVGGGKFETWLGSIIQPGETFYLASDNKEQLGKLVDRAAAIGYEGQVKEAFVLENAFETMPALDVDEFKGHTANYTVVDVRNNGEVSQKKIFANSIHIPLGELRKRWAEIPTNKPIVVHCAGGTRSAAASSLLQEELNGSTKVYDLGEAVKTFG
ncbi:rhodanese-like domain-containing protein [Flavisolibacter tropicus]|uniref:Sulfurtransferase n=1 Tax=Flavisolibacter tropicus TaxID=1492898 RepID=A0A172TT28_9BACT|nr:rhodanese-like domain-containing protein [Flavisolibacter tropicus]ANE49923.1 sulfurtransferase [Flavisolibacter tropicus]